MKGSEPYRANPPKFQIWCYCSFQPKFGPSFSWQSGPTLKGNERFFSPLWTLNHGDFRHNTLRNNGLTLILLTISPLAQTCTVPCAINKMADRSEQSSSNNSCKRKLNPEEWKRNKRTSLRNMKMVPEVFWELGDWTAQNAFLCGSVKVKSLKRRMQRKLKLLGTQKKLFLSILYKRQRNIYLGIQKRLSYTNEP